jgi:hypothetical protein
MNRKRLPAFEAGEGADRIAEIAGVGVLVGLRHPVRPVLPAGVAAPISLTASIGGDADAPRGPASHAGLCLVVVAALVDAVPEMIETDDEGQRRPGLSDPRNTEVRPLAGAAHRP